MALCVIFVFSVFQPVFCSLHGTLTFGCHPTICCENKGIDWRLLHQSMPITLLLPWLYLSFLFHVVGRSLKRTNQNKTMTSLYIWGRMYDPYVKECFKAEQLIFIGCVFVVSSFPVMCSFLRLALQCAYLFSLLGSVLLVLYFSKYLPTVSCKKRSSVNSGAWLRRLDDVYQGFPTCGTRTTSGTRRSFRWYATNFLFFTKTWSHSFLVYVSGFVSK